MGLVGPDWNPHCEVGWAGMGYGASGALGQAGLRVRTVRGRRRGSFQVLVCSGLGRMPCSFRGGI